MKLGFGALPAGVLADEPASATVAITDNDLTVSFRAGGLRGHRGRERDGHGEAERSARAAGGDPADETEPGRRGRWRLHGSSDKPDLRERRHRADLHGHCGRRRGGRRRGERAAELRRSAAGGSLGGRAGRGHGGAHRQRRGADRSAAEGHAGFRERGRGCHGADGDGRSCREAARCRRPRRWCWR